jgi:hypothetical protein
MPPLEPEEGRKWQPVRLVVKKLRNLAGEMSTSLVSWIQATWGQVAKNTSRTERHLSAPQGRGHSTARLRFFRHHPFITCIHRKDDGSTTIEYIRQITTEMMTTEQR